MHGEVSDIVDMQLRSTSCGLDDDNDDDNVGGLFVRRISTS